MAHTSQAGVQNGATSFGSLSGPDLDLLPVNSDLTFDWTWATGFGRQWCFINGARAINDADRSCKSPLTFALPNRLNHTLTILLQARCNVQNGVLRRARLFSAAPLAVACGCNAPHGAMPLCHE